MSSNQELEEPRRKQLNLGLFLQEETERIKCNAETTCLDFRKYFGAKISDNTFMKDMLDTFGSFIPKWLLTPMSRKEAHKAAIIEAIKKAIMREGAEKFMAKYQKFIAQMIDQAVTRFLEEHFDEIVAWFKTMPEEFEKEDGDN